MRRYEGILGLLTMLLARHGSRAASAPPWMAIPPAADGAIRQAIAAWLSRRRGPRDGAYPRGRMTDVAADSGHFLDDDSNKTEHAETRRRIQWIAARY